MNPSASAAPLPASPSDEVQDEARDEARDHGALAGTDRHEMVFLPADPPRQGRFALFVPPGRSTGASVSPTPLGGRGPRRRGRTAGEGALAEGSSRTEMELVFPAGGGVRRRTVPAELVPVDSALRRFLDTDPAGLSESAGVWSAVVVAGVNLEPCPAASCRR